MKQHLVYYISCILLISCASSSINKMNSAQQYTNQATKLAAQGQTNQALQASDAAIQIDSNYAPAYIVKASIYENNSQANKARQNYQTAIRLNPTDQINQTKYASFLCSQKEYNEAFAQFNTAIEINPNNAANAYLAEANCYATKGDLNTANDMYLKTLSFDNSVVNNGAYLGLARLYLNSNNYILANHYLNTYKGAQTAQTLYLQLQALSGLLSATKNHSAIAKISAKITATEKTLRNNFPNSKEAQSYIAANSKKQQTNKNINNEEYDNEIEKDEVINYNSIATDNKSLVTVLKGDTLFSIAKRNNTSVQKLKELNHLKNNNVSVGSKLRIR